jgi:putative ABC transport system permease protein
VVDILRPEIIEGEFLTNDQDASLERVVVIGSDVSENFFGIDASPIGETIQIKDKTFRIIGVAKSSSALAGGFINNAVFIPIHVGMADIFTTKALQEIDISVHDTRRINETMNDIELLLRNSHNLEEGTDNDFRIESAQDVLSTVQTVTGLLTTMIVAISGISLVVGGVGVMNIMLVSVTERTKEIGLLKAIGAKDRDILLQFLIYQYQECLLEEESPGFYQPFQFVFLTVFFVYQ